MRAKTSMQAKTWFPKGAERNNMLGVALLDPSKPPLPSLLGQLPPLAEFKVPFKREEEVTRTILEMHEKHPEHMTQAQHVEWTAFLHNRPRKVADVAVSDRPTQKFTRCPHARRLEVGPRRCGPFQRIEVYWMSLRSRSCQLSHMLGSRQLKKPVNYGNLIPVGNVTMQMDASFRLVNTASYSRKPVLQITGCHSTWYVSLRC